MPSTFLASAGARADRSLVRRGAWTLSAGLAADATHHGRDLSGLDGAPESPRLFSPALFAAVSPRAGLAREVGAARLAIDAGPALQLVSARGASLRGGGDVRASVVQPLGPRLRLSADLRAERVATAYSRVEGGAALAVVF